VRLPDLREAARLVFVDARIGDDELNLYANEALLTAATQVFLPDMEAAASVVVPAGTDSVPLPGDFHRELFSCRNGEGGRVAVLKQPRDMERREHGCPTPGLVQAVAAVGTRLLRVWPKPETEETLVLGYYRRPHVLEQQVGSVAFDAAAKAFTATAPIFGRFRYGDVLTIKGSARNDKVFTVVSATSDVCVVAENVADEPAVEVDVLALDVEAVPEELHRNVLVNGILARAYETKEDALEGKRNTDRFMALTEKAFKELKMAINATGYRARTADCGEIRRRSLC
jgi:hypothetical protein